MSPLSPRIPQVGGRAGSAASLHEVIPYGTVLGGFPWGWNENPPPVQENSTFRTNSGGGGRNGSSHPNAGHFHRTWPTFTVEDRLGAGSFGCVYQGCRCDGLPVAIKVEPMNPESNKDVQPEMSPTGNHPPRLPAGGLLPGETNVLLSVAGVAGYPAVHWYGNFAYNGKRFRALIMDALGSSLQDLLERRPIIQVNVSKETKRNSSIPLQKRIFSTKTVCMIADQMITRLETLHERGYLHRDLKPGMHRSNDYNMRSLCLLTGCFIFVVARRL
jgi:serine/threonine protein kinase